MKNIYLFTVLFTVINIYIYYYVESVNTCIDTNSKILIILFYGSSLIYLIHLYFGRSRDSFANTPSINSPIIIDLSTNPDYNSNSVKIIYWSSDFNVNGMVDIIDKKAVIEINQDNQLTYIKYRIIDNKEKLSMIYSL